MHPFTMTWTPVYTINNKLLATMRAIGEAYGMLKALPIANIATMKPKLDHQSLYQRENNCMFLYDHIGLNAFERDALNCYKTSQLLFRTL
jgi:hypothetical protein